MPDKYLEGLQRAEQIFQRKYKDQFMRDFPEKAVAIDIVSEQAFVADDILGG